MKINATYTRKYAKGVLVLSFEAGTQMAFNCAASDAADEAVKSFPHYTQDLRTDDGDQAVLESWAAHFEYVNPAQRAAQ